MMLAVARWRRGYLPAPTAEPTGGPAFVSTPLGARLRSLPLNLGERAAAFLSNGVVSLGEGGGLLAFPDYSVLAFILALATGLAFAVVLLR